MKVPANLLVVMCACVLLALPAAAQITITAADVDSVFAVGKTIIKNDDTTMTSANIGTPGASNWDFTGLLADVSTPLTSVTPASTTYAGDYPGATHALEAPFTYLGFTGTGYQYLQIGTSVLNMGTEASAITPLGVGVAKYVNTPLDQWYATPSTIGTTWTSAYTEALSITINGVPFGSPIITSHNFFYKVDAYGPMTLPGGKVSQALRIRRVDSVAVKIITYIFLSNDGATVQLNAADSTQPDNGVISVARTSVSWTAADPALPIQLAAFKATIQANGGGVLLSWKTLSEQENYGFDVQRRSGVAGEFATIPGSFVAGHGTTVQPQEYSYLDASAPSGHIEYRLKQIDRDGSFHYSDPIVVNFVTGVRAGNAPLVFSLSQNYPNPFNPTTMIRYSIARPSRVVLTVSNALGQTMMELVDADLPAGEYSSTLDGAHLASGVYFYTLRAGTFVQTRRLILLR
jgi:hypothetical protein